MNDSVEWTHFVEDVKNNIMIHGMIAAEDTFLQQEGLGRVAKTMFSYGSDTPSNSAPNWRGSKISVRCVVSPLRL